MSELPVLRIALYVGWAGVIYLAYFRFFSSYQPLRKVLDALPRPQKIVIVTLFGLMALGQIIRSKHETYPFIKWGMYDELSTKVRYYEYRGVLPDGTEAEYPVSHLLRIPSPELSVLCPTCGKRFLWKLRDLGHDRRKLPPGPERDQAARSYDELLRAAWQQYQRRHPDAAFQSVRVFYRFVRTGEYTDESSISREYLWTVDLL
ncbi:MAG: hypothetical protein O7G30_13455 [Proteobacteria bacterium]|nr:hypothetical protein [Pseudomonadota bacterium]